MKTDEWPVYWTVEEVAGLLRVSKMTVYRIIHQGDLKSIRVGKQVRVPDPELRKYLSVQEGSEQ